MLESVIFKNKKYKLIITSHARDRMEEREVSRSLVVDIIETGIAVRKSKAHRWWIYKKIKQRSDNDVCLSISIESPNLIVITALVKWRPIK